LGAAPQVATILCSFFEFREIELRPLLEKLRAPLPGLKF
jgi:hypothetical protein